jgi:energy-coupling factor transporter ATP-binding protein EcfA2
MTLYNPHTLARQDLIETFVARQPLLDGLLDGLRHGGGQHHLLVGSRGSGKTTLLLRLAAAIEDDQQLGKKCIPLRFPEEQYNVSRASDFWMNAIDALVDALERQDDRMAARRLESSLAEVEQLEESERAKQSLTVLERWAKQARRLIVLLVDNVDLVLDRLADSLWDLREALSIDNGLVVIGASSKFIEEAIDYQSPFYDFFHIHELGPLSEEDAREVVLSLARRANTPRVAEILERDPGRFKALYVLTGGTPRTLALLHTVLALDHSDRVERDLEGLLDQLTPYYKARFDDLPAQSQVIVDKVALHWHPITAAACQAATHLDLNTVSAQLSRLVKNGLLTKVSLPGPNKLGFQLSERFFNIWYLMRASRRLRHRLSWFIEFLRVFYGEEDLRRRAEDLVRAAPHDSLNSPAKFLSFASAIPDEALRRRLEFRAIGPLMSDGIAAIREVMDLEGDDAHLAPVVDRVRALREIRARIAKTRIRWPAGHTSDSISEMLVRHPMYPLHLKQKFAWLIEHSIFEELNISIEARSRGMARFDIQLLDAIASGELPSLSDATTAAEVQQIVELGGPGWQTTACLVTATECLGRPLADKTVQLLLQLAPQGNIGIMIAASTLVELGHWSRARSLVLQITRQFTSLLDVAPFLGFARTCIAQGLSAEAADLLVEAGLAERWAPLSEVLRAVADGSKSRLDGLAPEVRVAAIELFDLIRVPAALPARDGGFDLDSKASPPSRPNATSRQRLGARKQGKHPRRPRRNLN